MNHLSGTITAVPDMAYSFKYRIGTQATQTYLYRKHFLTHREVFVDLNSDCLTDHLLNPVKSKQHGYKRRHNDIFKQSKGLRYRNINKIPLITHNTVCSYVVTFSTRIYLIFIKILTLQIRFVFFCFLRINESMSIPTKGEKENRNQIKLIQIVPIV